MDNSVLNVDVLAADRRPSAAADADDAGGSQQQQGRSATTRRPRSARAVFGRLLEHGAVPQLIVLTVFLCGVYVLLRLAVDLLDVRRLAGLGAFSVYARATVSRPSMCHTPCAEL